VDQLRAAGASTVETVAFDAHDTSLHGALIDDVFDRFGDIDLALVAFGVLGDQAQAERDPAAAIDIAAVNYLGTMSVCLPIARRMREQGHGTIVALSSVAGERARKGNFVYGSSKAGMDAFLQGLGDSLAGTGVNVMVVRPGFVHTKMTAGRAPAPLSTTADAVADAIVDGLARGRETVWVPSSLRYVMSVLRHVPRPVFRKLPM
jgi:decaprenylphospho-beta-D-erythro-pentofuranosid-2-ulose 2-reductase